MTLWVFSVVGPDDVDPSSLAGLFRQQKDRVFRLYGVSRRRPFRQGVRPDRRSLEVCFRHSIHGRGRRESVQGDRDGRGRQTDGVSRIVRYGQGARPRSDDSGADRNRQQAQEAAGHLELVDSARDGASSPERRRYHASRAKDLARPGAEGSGSNLWKGERGRVWSSRCHVD